MEMTKRAGAALPSIRFERPSTYPTGFHRPYRFGHRAPIGTRDSATTVEKTIQLTDAIKEITMRKMTSKCLAAAMAAALSLTGMSAAAAADIEIDLTNASGSTISQRGTVTCIGATCGPFPSIGAGQTETIEANLNSTSTSALIIFEYGTFSRRCRLSLRVTGSGGVPTGVSSYSFLRSAGTGSSPVCTPGSASFDSVTEKVTADPEMDI